MRCGVLSRAYIGAGCRSCLPLVGNKAGAIKPDWSSKPGSFFFWSIYTVNPSQEGKTLLWEFGGISLAMMGRSRVWLAWLRKKLQEQEVEQIKESSNKYEDKVKRSRCQMQRVILDRFNELEHAINQDVSVG
ncbi:hypothetical protein BHM03_00049446 [Ensete ventricosum]|nr:hypothetical protein BHM03_00049446 [Ensete ventricosum]